MNEVESLTLNPSEPIEIKKSVWELTREELIFPISISENRPALFVHMRPYRAFDLKQLLASFQYRMSTKPGANMVDLIDPTTKAVGPFFWKHFIKIANLGRSDGSVLNLEEQKQWIEANSRLRIEWTIITQGYRGLELSEEKEESSLDDSPDGLFVIDDEADNSITVAQKLWDPTLQMSQRIEMQHGFRNCRHSDLERYKEATRSRVNTKKQEWTNTVNYDVVEQLYDSMILSADGFEIGGTPCQEANKKDWVGLIPFWHKDIVLANYFRGVTIKNV